MMVCFVIYHNSQLRTLRGGLSHHLNPTRLSQGHSIGCAPGIHMCIAPLRIVILPNRSFHRSCRPLQHRRRTTLPDHVHHPPQPPLLLCLVPPHRLHHGGTLRGRFRGPGAEQRCDPGKRLGEGGSDGGCHGVHGASGVARAGSLCKERFHRGVVEARDDIRPVKKGGIVEHSGMYRHVVCT